MVRTPEEWAEILARCGGGDSYSVALRILGDLIAYRSHTRHEGDDAQQLANALDAWLFVITGEEP
jgi:hypothetical protein